MTSGLVVVIGLDAADLTRIERLSAAGATPAFAKFMAEGARGSLQSLPMGLSTTWPKWFEGGRVGSRYFAKQWDPDRMCLECVTATRGDPEPFWSDLDRRGLRVCIVDVPLAAAVPLRHGLALQGWQVHDFYSRWSTPGELWRQLTRRHGRPPLGAEDYGPQSVGKLMVLREQLLAATRQAGEIACDLLARGPLDLFVIVLGALHRGGHYLWDTSQVDVRNASRDEVTRLEGALDEIYVAADRAVGQILERASSSTHVLLFALHGMGANGGWSERFQAIASAVAAIDSAPRHVTALQRLRHRMPARWAQRAAGLAPYWLNSRLLEYTSARMHDWRRTPWFALPSDLAGFLRLNVRGRESRGILHAGVETRETENRLVEMFAQLTDLDGRPVVAQIERMDEFVDSSNRFRRYLPDLLLSWDSLKASDTGGVRLGACELMRWMPGEFNNSGRSGNHVTDGWYSVIGPGIEPVGDERPRDINGIVPTIYQWMGVAPPNPFRHEPLIPNGPAAARAAT